MPSLPPLAIKYPRQMKLQRIYPVTVKWAEQEGFRTGGIRQVTLRLLMAGGQVLPGEQTLDAQADAQVTFYVTPLGVGWLREQRLEVLIRGRKVQEIPLSSKVTCHAWTKFFLLMVFVGPWLLGLMYAAGSGLISKVTTENIPEIAALDKISMQEKWQAAKIWAGDTYGTLWAKLWSANEEDPNLWGFVAVVAFLGLALLSAWWHRDVRRTKVSEKIPIPESDDDD